MSEAKIMKVGSLASIKATLAETANSESNKPAINNVCLCLYISLLSFSEEKDIDNFLHLF